MKKLERKSVEIKKVRMPLRKLLHGKEIRAGAKELENFRLKLLEEEFMLGAKLTIKWINYDEAHLVATRLETDKEFNDRLERLRLAEEAKIERARIRKLQEEERKKRMEEERKHTVLKTIQEMAKANNISPEELVFLLDKTSK